MRYLPLTPADRTSMLATIGASSIDDLFIDVPAEARLSGPIAGLPMHQSEMAVERHFSTLARKNRAAAHHPFFLGAGAYKHHIPASVDHLIQRGEFLTAYTPYQPEIAQGTLQVLFEFQTQVARLFGCDVANASMYDGSTACWEAIGMARRITKRTRALLSSGLHPQYVSVAQTMARFTGDALDVALPALNPPRHPREGGDPSSSAGQTSAMDSRFRGNDEGDDDYGGTDMSRLLAGIDDTTSCVVVQYPDILGRITELTALADKAHAHGALLIAVVTEPVALGLIKAPGEMGADIVVGEGQSLGVGLQFGGPYVGLFACKEKFVRQMPGRLCGETVDANGKRGFVLTLSTREQHIRREKATSNICTNAGLCALAFSIHMTLLGERGLREMAEINHARACEAADRLTQIKGVELITPTFFNEFTLRLPKEARPVVRAMAGKGVLGGISLGRLYPGVKALENGLVVAVTEVVSDDDIAALVVALEEALA